MVISTSSKYKLSKNVLKKYEPKLGLYFFYNTKTQTFWETDNAIGEVLNVLDGTLTYSEIIEIISQNNLQISKAEIDGVFKETFSFLLGEGYIIEYN